jgi:DNA primase
VSDDVVISHPEKVMFPDDGITKGELAGYYARVASLMLPLIRERPITMERFHRGIGEKGFFQKNVAKAPEFIETVAVPKKEGVVNYPMVHDDRGILWLANQNCITPARPSPPPMQSGRAPARPSRRPAPGRSSSPGRRGHNRSRSGVWRRD